MKYQVLEHMADLKIKAFGKDLAQLFKNIMIGMFESVGPEISNQTIQKRKIRIKSSSRNFKNEIPTAHKPSVCRLDQMGVKTETTQPSKTFEGCPRGDSARAKRAPIWENFESMLVDFLSEVLYLSDVKNEAYFEVDFKKLTSSKLEATLKGQKVKNFEKEIKAVTWHDLEIKKISDGWQAIVVFDI